MSNTENIKMLTSDALVAKAYSKLNESAKDRIEEIRKNTQSLPSILDTNTLSKLRSGDYGITLREYTNLNTYNNLMSVTYGNNSASPFQQYLNGFLESDDDKLANAKSFVDKVKASGASNTAARRLYSAMQSYSLISSFKNYNFVNAKV